MAGQDGTPPWGSHSDETALEPPSRHELEREALRREARSSLRRKEAFRTHAVVFALVNLLLFVIWLVTSVAGGSWFPWFVFPLFGWGIGLGIHGWTTYGTQPLTEERLAAEMERLRQRRLGS